MTRSQSNGARMILANGVELCIETFGDRNDPAILLIHGACASMLWWETELCERIAAHGRFVIRFDNRDTGRSVSYPPGQPGYTMTDMSRDAVGILDELGIDRAHIVGRSMAGAMALTIGVDYPERTASLTFVTTTTGDDDLPSGSSEVEAYPPSEPNFDEPTSLVEFIVGQMRVFSGRSPYFDESGMRDLAKEDVARTRNMASALTNHFRIEFDGPKKGGFGEVKVPSLIVHGELDPIFPLSHGQALNKAIPGSELLVLRDTGHEVPPPMWDVFVPALVRHTAG